MLSKLNDTPDMQVQCKPPIKQVIRYLILSTVLRQQYLSASEAHVVIRKVIDTNMENAPPRLVNTSTGLLCDREAQIRVFTTSMEYKKLLSVTMKHANLRTERILEVVAVFFQFVMLSHRWEGKEPLLHDIQDRSVYELDPVDGITKLRSFCKVVRDAGYHWAWSDTCCINKNNNVELQQSVNSMFVWYRHSALTIVYLCDVLPFSQSGALAMSIWNSRGWTVQEFLAPNVVLFYQKDWTLYLNDHSPNHKDSVVIMRELENATGINGQALIAFQPGMRGAREKLQWASMRVTTLQEDIAYSLFGIFGVHLPPIYGENKQNALGRLLQEIIAKSGDITCLDWVGKPSVFNSCLPASITSYGAPPSTLASPLSEDEMQTSVSSLRDAVDAKLASRLYQTFESLRAPQFIAARLHLPCIAFAMTSVRRQRVEDQRLASTFAVKAAGLRDLLITTEDKLIPFSRAKPIRQSFILVYPWDRSLLELHDFGDHSDTESIDDSSPPDSPLDDSSVGSLGEDGLVDSESYLRALRLIVWLGQPFSALLLAQQPGGGYKRIASDQNIVAQIKDVTTVVDMMDVRTVEIL
jgi:hypothetical protein